MLWHETRRRFASTVKASTGSASGVCHTACTNSVEGTGEDAAVYLTVLKQLTLVPTYFGLKQRSLIGQIEMMNGTLLKYTPNAKLVYNNSPSFNWTLNFRQQAYDAMVEAGEDVSALRDVLANECWIWRNWICLNELMTRFAHSKRMRLVKQVSSTT